MSAEIKGVCHLVLLYYVFFLGSACLCWEHRHAAALSPTTLHACVSECGIAICGGQRRVLDPLELELPSVVGCLM